MNRKYYYLTGICCFVPVCFENSFICHPMFEVLKSAPLPPPPGNIMRCKGHNKLVPGGNCTVAHLQVNN